MAGILEVDFASVLELRPELNAFRVRASVGWSEKVKSGTGLATGPDTHAGAAVIADRPVVIEDLRTDTRFSASRPLHEEGVISGASVTIPGWDGPYGVMSVHTTSARSFDAHDLSFLEAIANTLGGALRQRRSDEQLLHQALLHQALHDPLTDLPNRVLFHDRLGHALARANRHSEHTAVMLLDLDNFKAVNDSLGHAAGDELLMAVARRLGHAARAADTIARLGGDEFAILLEETV